jgi:alpha-mannosidase
VGRPGDESQGFSLINESKNGYDAKQNMLRLSLLRSPLEPDPNADRGSNHFSYALYPHAGTWKQALTVRHGYEYNYPLEAAQAAPHSGPLPGMYSFAGTDARNIVVTTMKKAEDTNALVFRLYDWAGLDSIVHFRIPPGSHGAHIVNLMEQPEGSELHASQEGEVDVPVHPFEIQSIEVDYPVTPSVAAKHPVR